MNPDLADLSGLRGVLAATHTAASYTEPRTREDYKGEYSTVTDECVQWGGMVCFLTWRLNKVPSRAQIKLDSGLYLTCNSTVLVHFLCSNEEVLF